MDIRDLRYFLMVAEEKSFTRAAERLFISQPALSKTIAELEADLGLVLINRRGKRIDLTESGQLFREGARRLVKDFDALVSGMDAVRNGRKMRLSIAFGMAGHIAYLSEALRNLKERHAGVDVSLERMFNADILDAVADGRIDVGIVNKPELDAAGALCQKTLLPCGLCAFLYRNHPLFNRSTVSIKDLAGERYITFERGTSPRQYDALVSLCAQNGMPAEPSFHAANTSMFTLLLSVEPIIGIMPYTTSIMFENSDIRRVPIHDVSDFDMIMVWKGDNANPAIPMILDAF